MWGYLVPGRQFLALDVGLYPDPSEWVGILVYILYI